MGGMRRMFVVFLRSYKEQEQQQQQQTTGAAAITRFIGNTKKNGLFWSKEVPGALSHFNLFLVLRVSFGLFSVLGVRKAKAKTERLADSAG